MTALYTPAKPRVQARWSSKDIKPDKGSLGPDAVRFLAEDPPQDLIQARLVLNKLVQNPPAGSIPMLIGPAMAQAMLERNSTNRNVIEARVSDLVRMLNRGEWQHNGETVKLSLCGQLLDGQHRLLAILRSGITAMIDVRFGLDRETFRTIDIGRPRTISDNLSIRGLSNTGVMAAGARLMVRYELIDRMAEYKASVFEVEDCLHRHPLLNEAASQSYARRKSGLPGSVTTFVWTLAAEYDRRKADDFFDILSQNGLGIDDKKHPIWRLVQYIRAASKKRIKAREWSAVTIKAWNAYATGKSLSQLSYSVSDAFPEAVGRKSGESKGGQPDLLVAERAMPA